MVRFAIAFLALICALALIQPVQARPEFLQRFQSDPMRKPDVDGCGTCHLNPRGGGTRNDFGTAFAAADHIITPMLRANFPDRFKFETAKLPNGSVFYFSDPESKSVVFEKDKQKVVIDLVALTVAKPDKVAPLPPPENRMSFFVTSKAPTNGGHLEGLAGADRFCQSLAQAAGAGDRTWHAYLSTSFQGQPAVNAGDRIGTGPWYNSKGMLIAHGPAELHAGTARLNKQTALTEKGEPAGDVDILTGTLPNGTSDMDMNCSNWTSNEDASKAMVGRLDGSWNSAHPTNGCTPKAFQPSAALYCFAVK